MAQVTYLGQAKMYSGDGVFRYTLPAYSMDVGMSSISNDVNIIFEGIFEAHSRSMSELQSIYTLDAISGENATKYNTVHTGHDPAVAMYKYNSTSILTHWSAPLGVTLKDGVYCEDCNFMGGASMKDHPALLYNAYYDGWTLCMLYIDVDGSVTGTVGQIYASTSAKDWKGRKYPITQVDLVGESDLTQATPLLLGFQQGLSVKNIRAKLNIHVGPNPPEDTNLLWVKNPTELPCSTFKMDTDEYVTAINPTPLTTALAQATAVTLDDKIWYCGGWGPWPTEQDDWVRNDEICCYDPATNTRTVLDVKLPLGLCRVTLAVIGKKIYMFGGQAINRKLTDQILVLDTTDLSLTVLDATLPVASYRYAAAVGETVYLFGGFDGKTELDEILAFDTTTNMIRTLDTKLPEPAWALGVAALGDKIYIFGGQRGSNYNTGFNHILRFNPSDESLTTMTATLPKVHMNPTPVVVGNNIWLLGGYIYSVKGTDIFTYYNSIDIYHPDRDFITPSGLILPNSCSYCTAGLVNGSIYVLGGMITKDIYNSATFAVDITPNLKQSRVYVNPIVDDSYPQVSLFAGAINKTGIRKLGMLTDDGYFDVPEAYVYKDGEWVYAYTDKSFSNQSYIYADMSAWTRNEPATSAYQSIVYDINTNTNYIVYSGVGYYETIYATKSLAADRTYVFTIDYYCPTALEGNYSEPYCPYIAFIPGDRLTETGPEFTNALATTLLPTTAMTGFQTFECTYTPTEDMTVGVGLCTGCVTDDVQYEFQVRNARLFIPE